mmetsp:Transcript_143318/g.458009  ORF Transcript_143318/g.458009 Transcript_143318/m.458009 type:complete len:252 (+) Transcript_143318:1777-2532(+)
MCDEWPLVSRAWPCRPHKLCRNGLLVVVGGFEHCAPWHAEHAGPGESGWQDNGGAASCHGHQHLDGPRVLHRPVHHRRHDLQGPVLHLRWWRRRLPAWRGLQCDLRADAEQRARGRRSARLRHRELCEPGRPQRESDGAKWAGADSAAKVGHAHRGAFGARGHLLRMPRHRHCPRGPHRDRSLAGGALEERSARPEDEREEQLVAPRGVGRHGGVCEVHHDGPHVRHAAEPAPVGAEPPLDGRRISRPLRH